MGFKALYSLLSQGEKQTCPLNMKQSVKLVALCYTMRGYRRMVSETLPAAAQAWFDRVTALPSYRAAKKADAETGERLKV